VHKVTKEYDEDDIMMSDRDIDAEDKVEDCITAITAGTIACTVPDDYGLSKIAAHLGNGEAVALYWEGAAKEQIGDIPGAMSLYRRAYRIWPALDSVYQAGLPCDVREEAETANFSSCGLLGIVNIADARASQVMHAPALLNSSDLRDIEAVRNVIAATETVLVNNPQNATHELKVCTFLNNPPTHAMRTHAPNVLGKMLRFGRQAWAEANWSGDADTPGPLYAITDGMPSLSIRVAEHWEYTVGGGLVDPLHYDVDSVLTLVALLSNENDFEGGTFRTLEADNSQLEHPMAQGGVICFISHKYHNVVPVTKGIRRSFVMELWQGGLGHIGR
jgi:hypothetical protein